jgi:hypothetical protein
MLHVTSKAKNCDARWFNAYGREFEAVCEKRSFTSVLRSLEQRTDIRSQQTTVCVKSCAGMADRLHMEVNVTKRAGMFRAVEVWL